MKIEILGPGCPRCHETERRVMNVLAETGTDAEVTLVSDLKEIAKRKVMFTPAVLIDGAVRVSGRVPSVAELRGLFQAVGTSPPADQPTKNP
ncbi:MAG: thioredoxin family protein [Verrucomicrobia bacterium]|nr:thioredoxin family protein [Verrucomicrobiota bacterium]